MARTSSDAVGLSFGNPVGSSVEHRHLPLVVDLDGFLIQADISGDTEIAELEQLVLRMRRAVRGDVGGISPAVIAEYARQGIDVSRLRLQCEVVAYVEACIEAGRSVHLVTSASQEIADAVAARIGAFSSVAGAVEGRAMLCAGKLDYARRHCRDGFVYAGRVPSLIAASASVVAPVRDGGTHAAARRGGVRIEAATASGSGSTGAWMRLLGCDRWIQHALVFLPMLMAPLALSAGVATTCLAGFLLMCAAASGVALVEALVRLHDDRRDVARRHRPYALGEIEPGLVAGVAALLGAGSLAAALTLSVPFFLCLVGFIATRLAFVRKLRRRPSSMPVSWRAAVALAMVGWPLAIGAVLAGLGPAQALPAVVAVLAVIWLRRYCETKAMLRRRGNVSGLELSDRVEKLRRQHH